MAKRPPGMQSGPQVKPGHFLGALLLPGPPLTHTCKVRPPPFLRDGLGLHLAWPWPCPSSQAASGLYDTEWMPLTPPLWAHLNCKRAYWGETFLERGRAGYKRCQPSMIFLEMTQLPAIQLMACASNGDTDFHSLQNPNAPCPCIVDLSLPRPGDNLSMCLSGSIRNVTKGA